MSRLRWITFAILLLLATPVTWAQPSRPVQTATAPSAVPQNPTFAQPQAGPGVIPRPASASTQTGFQDRIYQDEQGPHRYVIFVPHQRIPNRPLPAILFLHGAGERGRDGRLMVNVGLGPYIKQREAQFPFLVVFPQAEDHTGPIKTTWQTGSPDAERALKILAQVSQEFGLSPEQTAVAGWSMGGYGAWSFANQHRELFSAVVPMAGGLREKELTGLKQIPIWAFHGAIDPAIPVAESRRVISQLRGINPHLRYTEYPEGDHDVWRLAFSDDRLYRWLLNPTDDSIPSDPLLRTDAALLKPPVPFPDAVPAFVPALDIPHAFHARLGNDLLAQIADGLPQRLPPGTLSGQLPDVADATTVSGLDFTIQLSNISYSVQLGAVTVASVGPERLKVQLVLQQANIVIGATYVDGPGRKAAQAGPMQVSIGGSRAVPLTFEVAPRVQDRRIRLQVIRTDFQIPPDAWSVSPPSGVATQGLFMTSQRVSTGLVDGLYSSRQRVEQQVIGAVPGLVQQLEETLNGYLIQGDAAVAGIWPLPVYQPRIRIWPSDLVCDSDGISLCLGLTAAAMDPAKPPRWVIVPPATTGAAAVPKSRGLALGLAPRMMLPLSQLLIAARASSIHIMDTPTETLQKLDDPAVMRDLFPDLKRHGENLELSSILTMAAGIEPESTGHHGDLMLFFPKLRIDLSYRTQETGREWKPLAQIDVVIRHHVTPLIDRPRFERREFLFGWDKNPQIEVQARYASDYQSENAAIEQSRLQEIISEGWIEYTTGGPATRTRLPEFEVGNNKLRANGLSLTDQFLTLNYGPAGIKVTNASDKPVTYQTRGPRSDWSAPWKLDPGQSHQFDVGYAVLFRTLGGIKPQELMLPSGSHCEFLEVQGNVALYLARLHTPAVTELSSPAAGTAQPK